jgi:hypothetical protein
MSTAQEPSGTVVHEVRWAEALPWWILFRAAGAAFSPTVILLAALGALATWAGWSAADQLGLSGLDPAADVIAAAKAGDLTLALPDGAPAGRDPLLPSGRAVPWLGGLVDRLPPVAADVVRLVAVPFRPSATLTQSVGALARVGWFLLVWSIFGTAITRHVALKLVDEDAPGLVGATLFGSRKWTSAFNSALFVLVGIVALAVPGALLGLLMRTGWGLALAGAVWPLVLAGAVVLAILAVGLVAGWPLMVAAVGVERGDSFQAISTAFSYLYQRPLHYAFCAAVALVVALPALAVAGVFADLTGTFAMWAASFGMGHARTGEVLRGLAATGPMADAWGVRAIGFWTRGLAQLLSSFGWGYFWSIATAAYLVLRRDVDGTELDEVVIDEPGESAAR